MSTTFYRNGEKTTFIVPQTAGEQISREHEGGGLDAVITDATTDGEAAPGSVADAPVVMEDNPEPLRRRIANPRRDGLVWRILRRLTARREITPEEAADLEDAKTRKALAELLYREAKDCEKRMVSCMTRLGICYEYRRKDGAGSQRYDEVKFWPVVSEPNAHWFHINKLPHGVSFEQVVDERTTMNLSMSVGHKVMCRFTEKAGVWYIVERASGMMGIPSHVKLSDLWDRLSSKKDPLMIPVGIGANSRPIYTSLDHVIHALVAGTTGGGKSNFVNMVICTLLRNNSPAKLQMLLVDLKAGLEFNFYGGVPHLIKIPELAPDGIITEREGVLPLLGWIQHEGERRMNILRSAEVKNIGQYNAHRKNNIMPHLVCFIDEYADVRRGGKHGVECEDLLLNIVQRMRAVGIHMVVCTQSPTKEVISLGIKNNLPGVFAFNCSNMTGSMIILGNADAHNLQPVGRCVMQVGGPNVQVQTPYISMDVIKETVQGAITGQFGVIKQQHDVTQDEVREWAVKMANCQLSSRVLFEQYRGRGLTKDELELWLKSWDDKEFLIGSMLYKCEYRGPGKPRRLVVVNQEEETNVPTA